MDERATTTEQSLTPLQCPWCKQLVPRRVACPDAETKCERASRLAARWCAFTFVFFFSFIFLFEMHDMFSLIKDLQLKKTKKLGVGGFR